MKTEHILIIRFSAMGDVAMTVPVVYSLAMQYPHVRITVLSRPFARIFFEKMPQNVGFMEADLAGEYHGLKGLNALYRRLTAKKFTAIADLHDVLRSRYLRMRFSVDGHRVEHIDKHRGGKRRLTAQSGKILVQQPASFQNYADVLARLGYPIDMNFRSIYGDERGNLKLLNNKIGVKPQDKKWIGIAPFAAHKGKIYPFDNMCKVINLLHEHRPSARIFLFGGGKGECMQLDEMVSRYPFCVNASALLNGMEEELVLMSNLDVMISMDSANMHLASLVSVPVVSVWGATHPYAGFMGWNQSPNRAVQIDLHCRPCSVYGNKPCLRGDYACLKNISPEMIVERTESVLLVSKPIG